MAKVCDFCGGGLNGLKGYGNRPDKVVVAVTGLRLQSEQGISRMEFVVMFELVIQTKFLVFVQLSFKCVFASTVRDRWIHQKEQTLQSYPIAASLFQC